MSPDEIRDRLFESALHLFRTDGYDGTSVSRLTAASGVAKGTFFNHFPTKEHILAEFLGRIWEEAVEETDRAAYRGTDAIIHVLDGLLRPLEGDRSLTRAIALRLPALPLPERFRGPASPEDTPSGKATPSGSDARSDPPALLAGYWARWVRERLDESLPIAVPIQAIDAEDLAALVVGALMETLRQAREAEGPPPHLPLVMGRRAVFLLRSAGFVAPDPPALTRS